MDWTIPDMGPSSSKKRERDSVAHVSPGFTRGGAARTSSGPPRSLLNNLPNGVLFPKKHDVIGRNFLIIESCFRIKSIEQDSGLRLLPI